MKEAYYTQFEITCGEKKTIMINSKDTNKEIVEKIQELEIKLSFQDDLLNTLNDVVTKQDQEIYKLWQANKLLKDSMKELKEDNPGEVNETPPHY